MQLSETVIQRAFNMHNTVYHGQRLWNIPYHITCWEMGAQAFEEERFDAFESLYAELKNRWQALRPKASTAWTPRTTWEHLRSQDQHLRTRSLSNLDDRYIDACYDIVTSMAGIKPMKFSPSIVAISKFLHFWNPRLFVVVDYAVIWRWVLAHKWIWNEIMETRNRIQQISGVQEPLRDSCDISSYIAVLRWSADLITENPRITDAFEQYVRTHRQTDLPIADYEAAAIEWLLLGLVELPPEGVKLDIDRH